MQVLGGIGFTMEVDVAKLHADSLVLTVYEGTSEIQASFALREMGKGALATLLAQVRGELEHAGADEALAPLAERVKQSCAAVDESAKILFSDLPYALLRAKLVAEMVINLIAASELLQQAQADPGRRDLAEAFVIRRMLENELGAKRIAQNHAGRLERDARILAQY
jgi:alkylation response protein AidB-like acyl-CoA dehydrogenase